MTQNWLLFALIAAWLIVRVLTIVLSHRRQVKKMQEAGK